MSELIKAVSVRRSANKFIENTVIPRIIDFPFDIAKEVNFVKGHNRR